MDIRVLLYEDNNSLRHGLYQLINGSTGFTCVGAFPDCSNLLKQVQNTQPDVVLMDIELPGMNGIEAVGLIKSQYPQIKILMQTIFEDGDKIFQSILAGASGYILKNTTPSRFLEFIKETYEGGAPMSPTIATKVLHMLANPVTPQKKDRFDLSPREVEILHCLVKGMSYKLIADACNIKIDTVRNHIRSIYEKLQVHSKGEAIVIAIKDNIIRP